MCRNRRTNRGRGDRLKIGMSESKERRTRGERGLERGQLFQAFVDEGGSDLSLLFLDWRTFSVKMLLSHKVTQGYKKGFYYSLGSNEDILWNSFILSLRHTLLTFFDNLRCGNFTGFERCML